MAALSQEHLALLRRHQQALVRFASLTKMPLDKLAFIVADRRSNLGQATTGAGVVITERASVVLPVTVEAVPALLAAARCHDVREVTRVHGAVPVVLIDQDNEAVVVFERVRSRSTAGSPVGTFP